MTRPLNVGIVEDHPLFRRALERLLEAQGWCVVFAEGTLADARSALQRSEVDVVLLDVALPDGSGYEMIESAPEKVGFLVVTSQDDGASAAAAERAGATGFVSKLADDGAIAAAVRDVAAGRRTYAPRLVVAETPARDGDVLTQRERECLVLIAEGMTNREIASILGIGIETVKTHVASILLKSKASDRAHAIAHAFRVGWV